MAGPSPAWLAPLEAEFGPPKVLDPAPAPVPAAQPFDLEAALGAQGITPPGRQTYNDFDFSTVKGVAPDAPPSPAPSAVAAPAVAPVTPKTSTVAGPPGPSATPVSMPSAEGGESPTLQVTPDVQFRQVGGGASPAHEAYMRGAKQDAHLMRSFEPQQEAAARIDMRNQLQADREEAVYEDQAARALQRQDAAERVMARRQNEQSQLMQDYQDQIQRLGEMHLDDNRWWSKKSTGDKIGTTLLAFLGGISALGNGGKNLVYDRILQEIDNDLAAQKFDYQMGMEQAKGAQNAFAMMMDRYGTEDAATAAARAAALDYTAARANQIHAQYGGTESANQRDQLVGQLGAEKERTISNGFKFIPAGLQPGKYKMVIRGQVIPGLVDEKTAQQYAINHGVAPAEKVDQAMVEGGIQATVAGAKAAAEQKAKEKAYAVVMPNGETVNAPNEAEAKEVRDLSTAASNVKRLVREAKEIRDQAAIGVPMTPAARGRLGQIQKDLVTSFAVQNKLGALSKDDMDLAIGGTADLFQLGNGVEARLDRLNETAIGKVSDRVATYPGAPPKSSGVMPSSFKAHK